MASPSTCFLEHQLVKPVSAGLVLAAIGLVVWVAVGHMSYVESQATGKSTTVPQWGIQVVSPDDLVARMFAFPPGEAVLINQVLGRSLAERAGLRPGDGIAAVNGQSIQTPNDVAAHLESAKQGDLLELTVIRGGLLHNLLLPWDGPAGG